MKKRKKCGSALVLVMIFALFFTIISGATVLAVSNTFKANGAEEEHETLYYEADAGVEKAIAYANAAKYDSLVDESSADASAVGHTFDMNEGMVSINVKKTGDKNAAGVYIRRYLLVESTATSKENNSIKKKVTSKLNKSLNTSDIFKYLVCGTDVNINFPGAGNIGSVNSANVPAEIVAGGSNVIDPSEKATFTIPEFNFDEIPTANRTINSTGDLITKLDAMTIGNNGVKKINFATDAGINMKIFLINSPTLIINTPSETISDVIILTNANIKINVPGNINLSNGSIVGKEVVVGPIPGAGSIHMNYPPFDNPNDSHDAAHSHLKDNDLLRLNQQIAGMCSNWDVTGGGASSGSTPYQPGEYQ